MTGRQPGLSRAPAGAGTGLAALAYLAVLAGGAFLGLAVVAAGDLEGALGAVDPYMLRVARFTLWQAALSTLLSVIPALFVARAFFRHPRFPGRRFAIRLFALPLAIPALVAALGVLALYGRAGIAAPALAWLSGDSWSGIFGLSGILLAHVFFNLPLATRLFLEALDAVPDDRWRLASQLSMGARPTFRIVEWPALRAATPGIAALVFMLCATSFTVVLTLGGGPRATTMEVAIYQALRFDFDPARAVALTALQVTLTALIVVAIARLGAPFAQETNITISPRRYLAPGWLETLLNAVTLSAAIAFVAGPIAATVIAGLSADLARLAGDPAVHRAVATSLVLSFLSGLVALALSFALVRSRQRLEAARQGGAPGLVERLSDNGASLILVVPAVVIGAGWFILLHYFVNVFAVAPVMVVAVNAAMALPFAMRALRPAHDAAAARHDRLAASLAVTGFARLRLIDWPALRGPALTAFAFAMALSLGDLGVIALFGSDSVQTLPYLLLARLGSYRTADAAGLALILATMCLTLIFAAERMKGKAG
ncbi:MAG: thiamine/thiamine pyrophosphate ABC transporter permease [Notoacmeibacter sp.]|nr:thiamine/thiamine pyrophosphate ABC transporter permease [Notoacmeibacter sp.]